MGLINHVVKEEIKSLERIKDTLDDRFDYLRLDKNERLLPFEKRELDGFLSKIHSHDISGYAELEDIYLELSKYLHVDANQILLASGSDLAIKSVYEACIGAGDKVVLHLPSYAMCRVYARMFGAEVVGIPVKNDWSVDVDKMLKSVDSKTKLVIMENPNGFVGTKPDFDQIIYCAQKLLRENVLFLIDEAYLYIENEKSETCPLVKKYENLIVSQTFSKCHGIAGTRFGYLVGHPILMEYISRVRPMHEITSLTALAVKWIIEHPEILERYRRTIKENKLYLLDEFMGLGIQARYAHGNFILVYFPNEGKTKGLTEKLKLKGILVRRPFEEPYLKGWMRITVGSHEDSKKLLEALRAII